MCFSVYVCLFCISVVVFRFALCKWLHFICRSLTATSSPQRSLVFQRFVSTVQGLSGDWTKDSSAKVINRNCLSFAVFWKDAKLDCRHVRFHIHH